MGELLWWAAVPLLLAIKAGLYLVAALVIYTVIDLSPPMQRSRRCRDDEIRRDVERELGRRIQSQHDELDRRERELERREAEVERREGNLRPE